MHPTLTVHEYFLIFIKTCYKGMLLCVTLGEYFIMKINRLALVHNSYKKKL